VKTSTLGNAFLFVAASLIATRMPAQESYFGALKIPPNSAGTCMPVPSAPHLSVSSKSHLVIQSVSPGQSRDLTVLVDTLGRTVGYSELDVTSTGLGSGFSEMYIAVFKEPGRVLGFTQHSTVSMAVPDLGHVDTASLRKMREDAKTISTKRALSPDEHRRAQALAEWLRKRCPS
jgi:hypothetical protein